jgi:hypothetical protein
MKKTVQTIRRALAFGCACALAAGTLLLASCADESWESLLLFNSDSLRPPQLEKVNTVQTDVLEAHFDKAAWVAGDGLSVSPDLDVASVEDGSSVIRITLAGEAEAGKRYTLEMNIRDEEGNTCAFLHQFYGYNPRIPNMLINEIIVNTPSTTAYNQVEIAVFSAGNMAGVTLFEGTKSFAEKTFTFPPLEVLPGDFILVHFNTAEAGGEIDETGGNKTEASGKGARDTAWDFWAPETGNLTKDNDVISLYTNLEGDLIDGIVYTSKTYTEGAKYNGFGTSLMLNKVTELVSGGGWIIRGSEPFPEDGFNPSGATSTRTICRDAASTDTNSAADWHIVPTGKRSPGAVNSNEVY